MNKLEKVARWYALLAGSCDGLTGILLMAAPNYTLRLMGMETMPVEPIWMQWIGAFVFSVGFSYYFPFFSTSRETNRRRIISLFEITAFIRIVIAVFTGVSIMQGSLDSAWISVTLTDAAFAAIQITFLKLDVFRIE